MGKMKKYFIHTIFATALFMVLFMVFNGSNSYSQGSEIESYFPFKVNTGYYYNMESKLFRYVECIETSVLDGELTGTFKTTFYAESVKSTRIDVYAVANSQVFLNYSKTQGGGPIEYLVRPIIVKLPKFGEKLKWINYNESDRREKYHHTSEYISSLKTNLGKFNNVILVTRDTYSDDKYLWTVEQYFAKGYGLVKEVWLKKGDKSDKPDVIELVKIK